MVWHSPLAFDLANTDQVWAQWQGTDEARIHDLADAGNETQTGSTVRRFHLFACWLLSYVHSPLPLKRSSTCTTSSRQPLYVLSCNNYICLWIFFRSLMLLVPLEGSCATLTSEALSFFNGTRTLSASSLQQWTSALHITRHVLDFFLEYAGNLHKYEYCACGQAGR